jgi:hypothetical protein
VENEVDWVEVYVTSYGSRWLLVDVEIVGMYSVQVRLVLFRLRTVSLPFVLLMMRAMCHAQTHVSRRL